METLPRPFGDRYTLERELARGGMGRVYVGRDRKLDRLVAIKVLASTGHDQDGLRRFEQEARTTGSLHHANMVAVFDAGEHEGLPYIVMELLQGETLRQRLQRGPVPLREAVDLSLQLLRGLAAAHDRGVVHRDLKPDNLFLTAEGLLKILDFGVMKLLPPPGEDAESFQTPDGGVARAPHTQTGAVVGTVGYMAPEQVRGQPVDLRADLFGFGAVLYELLSGKRAFRGASSVETAYSILTADPAPLPASVPLPLRRLTSRCLSKKREDRPQSSREVLHELEAFGQRTPTAPLPRLTSHAIALFERRRGWWKPALGAALLALAVLVLPRYLGTTRPGASLARVRTVAVLPFVVRGGAQFAYLGEGMVDLLSTNLSSTGALRAVDPTALVPAAAREKGPLDRAVGLSLAKRYGADLFVLGSVLEVEKRLHVQASLYDAEKPLQPLAEARAEGHASQLFHLVDQITAQLRSRLGDGSAPVQGPGGRLARLAQLTTHSPEALKLYLEGEAALRRSSFRSARDALQQAVQVDPDFALAHYRLAVAASISEPGLSDDSLRRALQGASRLLPRDRALLEAYAAFSAGRAAEAEARYRAIGRDAPDEVEAFWQLGEVLFHLNALRGRAPGEAQPEFARVLLLDPQHGGALSHAIDLAELSGDRQVVLALADRLLANATDDPAQALPYRWLRAWAAGDEPTRQALLDEIRGAAQRDEVRQTLFRATWEGDGFRDALSIARIRSEVGEPAQRAQGLRELAVLEVGKGQRRAARQNLRSAAELDPNGVYEHDRLWIDTLPFLPVPSAELQADLAAARALQTPRRASLPTLRTFLEGALAQRAGDGAAALAAAAALDQQHAAGELSVPQDLALGLRARVAAAAGRREEALAFLGKMPLRVSYQFHGALSRLPEQLLHARLLTDAGRAAQALPFAEALDSFSIWGAAYAAPALLEKARILEKLDRKGEAAAALRAYLVMREGCDDELAPERAEAQRRLQILEPAQADAR